MSRKTTTATEPTPEPEVAQSEAFVETPSVPTGRAQKISVKLNENGTIDWEAMPDQKIDQLAAALREDEQARAVIFGDGAAGPAPESSDQIEPRHVHSLLDAFSVAERLAFPPVLRKKYGITLDPRAVNAAFRFTPEMKEKLGEPGADTMNMLPQAVRHVIILASAPSAFLTALGECVQAQFALAFKLNQQILDASRPAPKPPTAEPQTEQEGEEGVA